MAVSTHTTSSSSSNDDEQISLALIKSDGLYRLEDIQRRLEAANLKLQAVCTRAFSEALAHRFYHGKYAKAGFAQKVRQVYRHDQQVTVGCIKVGRHNAVQRLKSTLNNADYLTRNQCDCSPTAEVAWRQADCVFPSTRRTVVVLGPPAGGKGTQCKLIADAYSLIHIATGDLLRSVIAHAKSSTNTSEPAPYGLSPAVIQTISDTVSKGALVSDELVWQLLFARLQQDDVQSRGFVLDGFPRTESQAMMMADSGVYVSHCIVLETAEQAIIDRVSGRRVDPVTGDTYHITFNPPPAAIADRCIQRSDDTAPVVASRLNTYKTQLPTITRHLANVWTVRDTAKPSSHTASNTAARNDAHASIFRIFHQIIDGVEIQLPPLSQVLRAKSSRTRERLHSAL